MEQLIRKEVKTAYWPDESANPFASLNESLKKSKIKPVRSYTRENGKNRQGVWGKYIRITRAKGGGYKRFLVTPTGSDPTNPYTELDYENTFQLALAWFREEGMK